MPFFLIPFIFYKLLFGVFIGSLLTFYGIEVTYRLQDITQNTKEVIFYFVFYSIIVYCVFLFIAGRVFNMSLQNNNFNNKVHMKFSIFLIILNLLYTLFVIIFDYNKLPIIPVINGDLLQAAYLRMMIQTHEISIGITYIGKFFFFLNLFLPIFLLLKLFNDFNKNYLFLFILTILLSLFNLTIDLQKSYAMLLILMLLFMYLYFKGMNKKIVVFSSLTIFCMSYIIGLLMGKENSFQGLMYIFDRLIFGQNQGMYFLFQYYIPNTKALFSDFYFASILGVDYIKPDEYILGYIYKNIENLVNSNTYFLGEAWSFFGYWGLFFAPILVSFILIIYQLFFVKLIKYDYSVFSSLALVFFSTFPIDQSLQLIIYQKYFLYFIFFAILPIGISLKISDLKFKRN